MKFRVHNMEHHWLRVVFSYYYFEIKIRHKRTYCIDILMFGTGSLIYIFKMEKRNGYLK